MSTKDFTANVISATKVVPDGNFKDSKASGIWDINEALDLIKGGNWPNVANINPAAFVDALFQITLYNGTGSSNAVTTGIDAVNNDSLLWIKRRSGASDHNLVDTKRGIATAGTGLMSSNSTGGSNSFADYLNATTTGFTALHSGNDTNGDGETYVAWQFRAQPKFFDIVTYTGDGQDGGRAISHNLGSVPGMIMVKRTSSSRDWVVYHRGNTAAPETDILKLNTTDATSDLGSAWYDTEPTASVFTIGDQIGVNANGEAYIAYIFAHNNDDGGFGEPGDQDIIKCGGYTGNAGNPQVIDVGFEPQFLMVKCTSNSGDWFVVDNMRGVLPNADYGADNKTIYWNTNAGEIASGNFGFYSTGFAAAQSSSTNGNGRTFIYMAIRRGGMQTPTAASDVFTIHDRDGEPNSSELNLGNTHLIDMVLSANRYDAGTTYRYITDRLRGDDKLLLTSGDAAESTGSNYIEFDRNTGNAIPSGGFGNNSGGTGADSVFWQWKRARGYFDIVAYTGNGSNRTITHNLAVAPEMMWVKKLSGSNNWKTFHANLGGTKSMELNTTVEAETNGSALFNSTAPSSSVFSLGTAGDTNGNSATYVAYLFATVANVSKVGSFTQSGATNVACGFTGDTPALIILKRTDDTGDWITFDSARGIVAGNDPSLDLNNTDAEVTNADVVDPYSGGFATTSSLADGDYIFYAIASIA